MLAIPLVTGLAGFVPAMFASTLSWLFMLATGLLFLEVTLWMPDGSNVISMASRFLGPVGKVLGALFFLFLYYCLMVSYIAGGAPLFTDALQTLITPDITMEIGFVFFTLLFGFIVLVGAWFVDRVNWILMTSLILSYFLMVGLGAKEVQPTLLLHKDWGGALFAVPILFSAYGYHNIIPSLSTYLKRNRQMLRLTVILGTTLPFIIYSLWQWLIIGSVPRETLLQSAELGIPASSLLAKATGISWVAGLSLFFGFFAIVTSLLGVSLSMVDFLGDGFHLSRKGLSRFLLVLVIYGPPALLAFNKPEIFITALGVAGGIGEAFLNGLLPLSMAWVGRYQMKLEGRELLFGGKGLLLLLFAFTIAIMSLECYLLLV